MKNIRPFIIPLVMRLIVVSIIIGTIIFLTSFLLATWRALGTTETILTLQASVARESLHRERFERVIQHLKAKTAIRPIDWKKIRDPF